MRDDPHVADGPRVRGRPGHCRCIAIEWVNGWLLCDPGDPSRRAGRDTSHFLMIFQGLVRPPRVRRPRSIALRAFPQGLPCPRHRKRGCVAVSSSVEMGRDPKLSLVSDANGTGTPCGEGARRFRGQVETGVVRRDAAFNKETPSLYSYYGVLVRHRPARAVGFIHTIDEGDASRWRGRRPGGMS